ncbi:YezD family protein [Anaerosinus massiliensis]|uniref:YezD family protein n=1 Tax=Massilibacillus massiliensis TaxID=1806837 RepID=UPI0018FEDF19|nr:YezD family protein [Massilibacillus massiliensis]
MSISEEAWSLIENEVLDTGYGTVILTVQDGCLIQFEKTEKFRLDNASIGKKNEKRIAPTKKIHENLRKKLNGYLKDIKFGQISINIKDYKISQIEKLEKHRFEDLQGLYGDGI